MEERRIRVISSVIIILLFAQIFGFGLMIYLQMATGDARTYTRRIISSESNSMSPVLDTEIYYRISTTNEEVNADDMIFLGQVYVYQKNSTEENRTIYVLHRLVGKYEGSGNRTIYIFKGDNNLLTDKPVYRDQIIERVVGVEFG